MCNRYRFVRIPLPCAVVLTLLIFMFAPQVSPGQHTQEAPHHPLTPAGEVQTLFDGTVEVAPAPSPEGICALEPRFDDTGFFLRPEDARLRHGAASLRDARQSALDTAIPTASIEVTYVNDCNGQTWPDAAIKAFEFAVEIWEQHVESEIPIRVRANWTNFGDRPDAENLLGSAGPTRIVRFDEGPGIFPGTWYPVALGSALSGRNIVDQIPDESFDINANLSCEQPRWHFDTNRVPPAQRLDFATVVLHEIGHGLGFTGSMSVDIDDDREVEEEIAQWGIQPEAGASPLPLVYDRFAVDGGEAMLIDVDVYANPSEGLYRALTGQVGGVFFDGPNATLTNEEANDPSVVGEAPPLFSPEPWNAGSSFSHVDQNTYTGTANALMRPFVSSAESVHSPGPVVCGILSDMGWPLGEECTLFFPPGLANLNASVSNGDVTLTWDAVGEFTNYRIEVAATGRLPDRFTFSSMARVDGAPFEITLPDQPGGTYVARVVPQDAPERRRTVTFTVGLEDALIVLGPGPNPFREEARVSFTVQETQRVSVHVYDAAGRRVATLFDGDATAGQDIRRTFDAHRLGSGVYFFRFFGEQFDFTETAVRVQ